MAIRNLFYGIFIVSILSISFGLCSRETAGSYMMSKQIKSINEVKNLFPKTPQEISEWAQKYMQEANEQFEQIVSIPAEKRTFANTPQAFDELISISNWAVTANAIQIIGYVFPDDKMREVSHETTQKLHEQLIDWCSDKRLYQAFQEYIEHNKSDELTDEQRYFLKETMQDFKRAGLHLPDDQLEQIKKVKKQLTQLSQDFDKNIAEDKTFISVDAAGLEGLDQAFIDALQKNEQGDYQLGVDYPTYFRVMKHGGVEDTRKRLRIAFLNRAYPANNEILKQIIQLRDQLAKMLGYKSYAHLDIDSQMAQSPERVEQFLADLFNKSQKKEEAELALFKKELPQSVSLTNDGKIKTWDLAYIIAQYKKKHFEIDDQKIAEYFPVQKTIDELLDIYRQFMSIEFEQVNSGGFWHPDVRMVKVLNKDKSNVFGYLFLDLYPRPNKYSHAAHANIVPGVKLSADERIPTVSLVMANFPKGTKNKPALFTFDDVKTFFHEFGHALHAMLGATQMGSFAGTQVKRDFVELPSQMLEEWMFDKDILKKVSAHYKTEDPLPDELINKMVSLRKFNTGCFMTRQCTLANIALCCFNEGAEKDPDAIEQKLYATYQPHIAYGSDCHLHASFGHLTGYGSKYYGYSWSSVFAHDLFEKIKQHGLLNPEIGRKYVQEIIGRGGSMDPNEMLKNFLGREPNSDAFMKAMGFVV